MSATTGRVRIDGMWRPAHYSDEGFFVSPSPVERWRSGRSDEAETWQVRRDQRLGGGINDDAAFCAVLVRTPVADAIAAWERSGPSSLTVALMADALYGVAEAAV